MKKRSILALILSVAILLTSIPFIIFAEGEAVASEADVKSEIPYGADITGVSTYASSGLKVMTEAQATAAGVPAGYSGHVLSLTGANGVGIILDLRDRNIKVETIESITFRVYCTANVREVRITDDAGISWISRIVPPATGEWIDITLTKDGQNISKSDGMACFADANGYFKPVNFGFRFSDTATSTVYIDSITLNIIDPDAAKEEIPFCDNAGDLSGYGGTQTLMNSQNASAAGIRPGYEGYVMSLCSDTSSNSSICIDLRQSVCKGVKISDVESVTFRVCASANTTGIRVKTKPDGNWQVNTPPTAKEQWIDFEVTNMSIFVDDGNGYFSPFVFAFRGTDGTTNNTSYIDSITVKLKEVETEAPETTVEETTAAPEPVDPNAVKEEIPYCDSVSGVSVYGYTTLDIMAATEISDTNISSGCSGYVMKLKHNSGGIGLTIDPAVITGEEIKLADLESITVRAYLVGTNVKNTRATIDGGTTSDLNTTPIGYDQWIEYTVPVSSLAYEDGETVSPFGLVFRFTDNTMETTVYIDSVTFKLKDVEEPPVEETTAAPEPEKPFYAFEEGMGKEEIPYGETDTVGSYYGYSSFAMMNEEQAIAAGVPGGYSGWVLALGASGGGISIGLDLTNIRTMDIERISFRIWCPTGTKIDPANQSGGIRLSGSNPDAWNMLVNPSALNEWIDVVLEKDDFSSFDYNGDGYCDPLNFCLRGATSTAYIDHIIVELRDPDTEPPVITYNGETVIETREGRAFVLDISAHDAYYDVDIELEYIWSEGAMVNGELVIGTHTCTVRATDEAGNTSEITITVNVGERDTEPPCIDWAPTEIYAMSGSQVFIDIPVVDNVDDLVATLTWSDGAIDASGRLCVGEHTLTVTATDLSGNTDELVIAVHVLETRPVVGELIEDSSDK